MIGNPTEDASQWTFQGANGYCGPNSISMMIEAATGHHMTEQQVAQWAISNHEMTHLPKSMDPAGEPSLHYGMLPDQAANALNALGSQYGITAEIKSGNMNDLEGYLKQGREVMIELDDQRRSMQISMGIAAWSEGLTAEQLLSQTRLAAQRHDPADPQRMGHSEGPQTDVGGLPLLRPS